jgi:hypothetical protein
MLKVRQVDAAGRLAFLRSRLGAPQTRDIVSPRLGPASRLRRCWSVPGISPDVQQKDGGRGRWDLCQACALLRAQETLSGVFLKSGPMRGRARFALHGRYVIERFISNT